MEFGGKRRRYFRQVDPFIHFYGHAIWVMKKSQPWKYLGEEPSTQRSSKCQALRWEEARQARGHGSGSTSSVYGGGGGRVAMRTGTVTTLRAVTGLSISRWSGGCPWLTEDWWDNHKMWLKRNNVVGHRSVYISFHPHNKIFKKIFTVNEVVCKEMKEIRKQRGYYPLDRENVSKKQWEQLSQMWSSCVTELDEARADGKHEACLNLKVVLGSSSVSIPVGAGVMKVQMWK